MKVFFGIARGNDGFINKIALRERGGKELFRLYRYSCLIEGDITVCGALCQTRFCCLVIVPSALASAEIQRGAIFFGEERECQSVALLAEFKTKQTFLFQRKPKPPQLAVIMLDELSAFTAATSIQSLPMRRKGFSFQFSGEIFISKPPFPA